MKFRTLILLLFVFISTTVVAQFSGMGGMSRSSATTEEHHDSPKIKQFRGDVFRGLSVHADVASPIVSLLGGYARSYEVQLDVNLYRRLFPIFEI
jgi:hypothetical protein